jgi:GNAT superfamily N-acetyltransferase
MGPSSGVTIRLATIDDAEAVARLSDQLGYPSTEEETTRRLLQVNAQSGHAVYVAEADGSLMGWVHVFVNHSLLADMPAEVAGLVVDENHRGHGVGRVLMEQAERWAQERGCRSVRLRSNVLRSRAHTFYERLGYQVIKSQKAFCKGLG